MTILGAVILSILTTLFICLCAFVVEKVSDGIPWWLHLCLSPFYTAISVLLTICLILPFSYYDYVPDPLSSKKVEIYSLGLNNGGEVNGHFVLGCGTVSGEIYPIYRFYTLTQDNRYHLNEVIAKNFDVVCTDTVEPCIVYNATKKVMNPTRKIFFDKDIYLDIEDNNLTGTIYIPKNSIVQSYKIQL